uniref:RNA recognition motif (A.K.A RRM, RBD, or RNP domain) protein n=1 Tax=Toxoplasma gondii COUG TaxID=1074873 RepID=A0A2G8YA10_TOXGO|nr:RNA recognition motif (A.K.A RRM, RBD, or RNP domain) protein [Toxoplasma gondii COUG]
MAGVDRKYTMRPVIPAERMDSCGRITIGNIPEGITEAQLKANLSHHGDAKVHMFVPACEHSAGWAWVSFSNRDEVVSVLQTAYEKSHARQKLEQGTAAEVEATPAPELEGKGAKKVNGASDKESWATSEGEGASSDVQSSEYSPEQSDDEPGSR